MDENPTALKIHSMIDEAQDIRSFMFEHAMDAKPGQFVMLWIPRVNMKPFGVSYLDKTRFAVTVCRVGKFTDVLFSKKPGDYVGIQGPYGKPFSLDAKNAVLVAGGYGAAPLAFLADELSKKGKKVTMIFGAKTQALLPYRGRFKGIDVIDCTDDGSFGLKGFTTDALRQVLAKDKTIDMIYTVGPEIMMKKVVEISDEHGIRCELSLERYMKCGFGVCGQCCVDGTGERICVCGPVLSKEKVKEIAEFGKYKRDAKGLRV